MLDFYGFQEQDLPYKCPECGHELEPKHCLGMGQYPNGGWRATMKPNSIQAMGFECPKCFTKSCFHADKYSIELYEDYKMIEKLKNE